MKVISESVQISQRFLGKSPSAALWISARRFLLGLLSLSKEWACRVNKDFLLKEFREFALYLNKQLFGRIPSISALSGLLVGSWIASTFTTSPFRARLASWGLVRGGTVVVSASTYKFLAVFLPVLATALTAYLVQKGLRVYRRRRLVGDMEKVKDLDSLKQDELSKRVALLDEAKNLGLLSSGEYSAKLAVLYQSYARSGVYKILEIIIHKISG